MGPYVFEYASPNVLNGLASHFFQLEIYQINMLFAFTLSLTLKVDWILFWSTLVRGSDNVPFTLLSFEIQCRPPKVVVLDVLS